MASKAEMGKKAPDFTAPTDGGGTLRLKELRGQKVVLYFYPKDMTSGCTKEAQDFRHAVRDFREANARIVGVSKDSPARHDKFKEKEGLPFTLVSDDDGRVCEAYGTWIEKSMYGRKYMGIDRATFLIDEKGTLRRVWRKVKVPGHVEEVLAAARGLV